MQQIKHHLTPIQHLSVEALRVQKSLLTGLYYEPYLNQRNALRGDKSRDC